MSRAGKPESTRPSAVSLGTPLLEDESDNSEDGRDGATAGEDANLEVPALDSDFEEDDEQSDEDPEQQVICRLFRLCPTAMLS